MSYFNLWKQRNGTGRIAEDVEMYDWVNCHSWSNMAFSLCIQLLLCPRCSKLNQIANSVTMNK